MTERTLRTICVMSMMSVLALVLLAYYNAEITQRGAAGFGIAVFVLASIMNVTWQLANGKKSWKWWQWIPQFVVPAIVSYSIYQLLCL